MFGRKAVPSPPGGGAPPAETPLSKEIAHILSKSAGQHPLDVAARLAALFSTRNYEADKIDFIRIQDINHPTVCDLSRMDGNLVGVSFTFYGEAGETGLIYLTTAFAQLAPLGSDPGPRVPAEMISRFVRDYEEAVRKLVLQRMPQRSPEELRQEENIRTQLSGFLG